MFLSSGNIVETVEADIKSLGRVLKEYMAKRLTGCINYREVIRGVYISISVIDGTVMGCRAVDRGVIYEGIPCVDIAMRYLYQPQGIVEAVEVPKRNVLIDLMVFPLSKLEEKTALEASLGVEVVAPQPPPTAEIVGEKVAPSVAEAYAPPPAPQEVTTVGVAEKPLVEQPIVEQVESPKASPVPPTLPTPAVPKEISIANECIDPVTLYSVMRSSQMVESVSKPLTLDNMMEIIKKVVQEKKPRYVYISGNVEDALLRIIHDSEAGSTYLELEKDGSQICGNNALEVLKNKQALNIRIWVVST